MYDGVEQPRFAVAQCWSRGCQIRVSLAEGRPMQNIDIVRLDLAKHVDASRNLVFGGGS